MLLSIRNAFITGIIVILPLGVTVIIINFLLKRLGEPASNLFFWFVDPSWRSTPALQLALELISVFVAFCLITLLGYGSRFVLGRIVLGWVERLLNTVPLINHVYRTAKQIVDTFGQQKKAVFQEVVLLEYPRKRSYVIGFLTSNSKGEPQELIGETIVNVFVPTTPNPTSGFLLMIPESDITRLQMSIADGMKLIISGGAVVPPGGTREEILITNPEKASGKLEIK